MSGASAFKKALRRGRGSKYDCVMVVFWLCFSVICVAVSEEKNFVVDWGSSSIVNPPASETTPRDQRKRPHDSSRSPQSPPLDGRPLGQAVLTCTNTEYYIYYYICLVASSTVDRSVASCVGLTAGHERDRTEVTP